MSQIIFQAASFGNGLNSYADDDLVNFFAEAREKTIFILITTEMN